MLICIRLTKHCSVAIKISVAISVGKIHKNAKPLANNYLRHKNYTRGLGIGIEFSAICISEIHDMTSKLHHSNLHSKTNTKIRDILFTGILSSQNFPLNTSVTKAAWY